VPTGNLHISTLNAVSCVSATACTAVGTFNPSQETLVESWNGTAWSAVPTPNKAANSNYLNAVSRVQATACNAVGFHHKATQGNGDKSLAESNDVVPSSR
jgi:hypothetical protein